MAFADKAHKVDGDEGAQACSSTPQAAGTSTLVALRPPLGAWYPRYQISFLALGSRSTPVSCSKSWSKRYDPLLRREVEGGHRLGSLG